MISSKVMNSMAGEHSKAIKELSKNFKYLEDHLIQVQENQVEFEKYLKKIVEILETKS